MGIDVITYSLCKSYVNTVALGSGAIQGPQGLPGTPGKQVEIAVNGGYIQWRYVGDAAWTTIVAVADLRGSNGTNGTNGDDGKTPELRVTSTHLQWRYVGDATWADLIALSALGGGGGTGGIPEAPNDGKMYGRKDEDWEEVAGYSPPSGGIPYADLAQGVQDSLDAADTALQASHNTSSSAHADIRSKIASLENLGQFAGSFNTYAAVPTTESSFTGLSVNDFVTVRADETKAGATTRYIVSDITAGVITWAYDVTYSTDITGKMDTVPTADEDNIAIFDNLGGVKDSGKTFADIVASADFNDFDTFADLETYKDTATRTGKELVYCRETTGGTGGSSGFSGLGGSVNIEYEIVSMNFGNGEDIDTDNYGEVLNSSLSDVNPNSGGIHIAIPEGCVPVNIFRSFNDGTDDYRIALAFDVFKDYGGTYQLNLALDAIRHSISTYEQTNGIHSTLTILYAKVSVMQEDDYDTCTITIKSSSFILEKKNGIVNFQHYMINETCSVNETVGTIPVGFRPKMEQYIVLFDSATPANSGGFKIQTNGDIVSPAAINGLCWLIGASWIAED